MTSEILVTKADGSTEPFEVQKLERSLRRAGASKEIIEEITAKVASELVSGMATKEIYKKAFDILSAQERKPIAARYSLKKAVFDLGPSGFPFEDFLTEMYRAKGYTVFTGIMLRGKCAEHEVDLVAIGGSGKKSFGAEVKFHNNPGIKTDLKVALYVYARFLDLVGSEHLKDDQQIEEGLLITNTKFTSNAIAYGKCVGLPMIGWDYPEDGNLFTLIGETGLHPITCLTTLPQASKKRLLDDKIVLCRSIKDNTSLLESYGVASDAIPEVLSEIDALCQPGTAV